MQERLDCAVLTHSDAAWADDISGSYFNGRLMLRTLPVDDADAMAAFQDPAIKFGRYDACLLHIDADSLGFWRTALSNAGRMPVVLMAYSVGLRAGALGDLHSLGLAGFMRPPFCPEDLRARLEHALAVAAQLSLHESAQEYALAHNPLPPGLSEAERCKIILDRSGAELEAYAVALAKRDATTQASFRAAKGEVVARFERAYIHAALDRHEGNITLAARMAQKHRRAFWALMRKHNIDPSPYRELKL